MDNNHVFSVGDAYWNPMSIFYFIFSSKNKRIVIVVHHHHHPTINEINSNKEDPTRIQITHHQHQVQVEEPIYGLLEI